MISTSRRAVGARAIARGVAIGLVLAFLRVARERARVRGDG
jgi:hypothetical protein